MPLPPTDEWLSISDLALLLDRDKSSVTRFVAKHQIETRPGRNRTKLVSLQHYLGEWAAFDPLHPAQAADALYPAQYWPRPPEWSGEPLEKAQQNRQRLERLAAQRERHNRRRRRHAPGI